MFTPVQAAIFALMKWFARVLAVYMGSQLHVALAFCALAWTGARLQGFSLAPAWMGTAFLGTALGYWVLKHGIGDQKLWFWLLFLGTAVAGIQLNWAQQWGGLVGVLMVLVYGVPLGKNRSNLRNAVGRWKVYWVALAWSWGTAIWPVLGDRIDLGLTLAVFALHFLWVLVLMIPFEVADLSTDPADLSTWPRYWGWRPLRWAGVVGSVIWCLGMCVLAPEAFPVFVLTALVLIGVLLRTNPDRPRIWVDFWVEGLPVLPMLLWMIWDYLSLPL